ncbi:hypothetical protein BgAZ_400990 [Babesia gibsoni]|uniref:Uncharacterized protein n=1 Tax=Babesia gibsoni TaxID=33632 RepID=A0AAD8PCZ3_BABGI|nr:hypothetical protein BgAZ_400990 [Babesia gibsoni]
MNEGTETQLPCLGRKPRSAIEQNGADISYLHTDVEAFSHDLMNIGNRETHDHNMLGGEVTPGDLSETVNKAPQNGDKFVSFAALKAKTFDNNFKDLEGLRRKTELLYLSERYLHSKLYTPKLEALQRLVEPGKYDNKEESNYGDKQNKLGGGGLFPLPQNLGSQSTHLCDYSGSAAVTDEQGDTKWAVHGNRQDTGVTLARSSSFDGYTSKDPKEKVITVLSSNEIVNGHNKKRISIPRAAYQPLDSGNKATNKVVLKVVGTTHVESPHFDWNNDPVSWLCALENHIEKVINSMELCGPTIVNPDRVFSELESIKPSWMPPELFYLLCIKPVGMDPNEFLELVGEHDIDECSKVLHNFNLVNTNAMGYVLDAENDTIKELMKLNRVHKRLVNEEDIYTRILSKMTDNFNSQVEDLLQTTRQDLRLAAGDTYLQYGRIKNITTWQKGDPVIREKGFSHDKAAKDKMKTLQRMQEVFGEGSHVSLDASVDEAKYIYYMKLLQDMEDSERDELQQQLVRDRTQALAEYSLMEPPFKPDNCLVWKTIGVSCKSIIWKMYNTTDCIPVIYKMRLLNHVEPEEMELLKMGYERVVKTIKQMTLKLSDKRQIKFATGTDVKEDCVVERMDFIRDIPVSELIEKTNLMTQTERCSQAQVIIREIIKLLYQLQGIDFVLPLKSSRLYISSGGITLSAGVPQSLLGKDARDILQKHEYTTIASMLWGKKIDWYLPPEANGDVAFTRDPLYVSKAHTWMIGKILYEATCQTPITRLSLDTTQIELLEDCATQEFLTMCLDECTETRPTVEELLRHPYMKKHKLNYGTFGPIDVGKAQCAVEILGDIETIVLNKINRTEKGVADYEQNENWDALVGESSEEDLCPLGSNYTYNFPNYRPVDVKK